MPLRTVLLIAMSLFLKDTIAQAQVRIFVKPESAIIKLDSIEIGNNDIHFISEGKHRLQAWAETYELKDTIIDIDDSQFNMVVFDLEPSEKYSQYLKDKKELKSLKFRKRQLPLFSVFLGTFAICNFSNNKYRKPAIDANERAKVYYDNYTTTLNYEWILEAEQNYIAAEKLYNENRKKHIITTSTALVVGSGLCFWIYLKAKKQNDFTKPIYNEPNLFSLRDFNFQQNNFGGLTFNLTLSL